MCSNISKSSQLLTDERANYLESGMLIENIFGKIGVALIWSHILKGVVKSEIISHRILLRESVLFSFQQQNLL